MSGINVVAPVNGLGYGVCGLGAVLGLEEIGKEPALWTIGPEEVSPEHAREVSVAKRRQRFYDPKAPSLRIYHQFDLGQHVGKGCHAGLVYFEQDKLTPQEVHHLNAQDVVIASSRWMVDVLVENGVGCDIRVARPGVDRSIFRRRTSDDSGKSSTTTFLAVGKFEVRKGHDALPEIFSKAFTPDEDVRLILLTENPFLSEQENEDWLGLYRRTPMASKILNLGRVSSQRDVAGVMDAADCGVFLSRAEGWNMPLAEMMAMGKHCVATDFSAHTEYCNDENAMLVGIDRTEEAFDNRWFHGFGNWAHLGPRQVDQAVEHLRSVHKRKQDGTLGVNQVALDSMRGYTWSGFAEEIMGAVS